MKDAAPPYGKLIACDALVGEPRAPAYDFTPDAADLEAEMQRLRIHAAIVRHRACLDIGGHLGNDILRAEIAGKSQLLPAWFVTPDGREPDFNPEATLQQMLAAGVRCAWTDPAAEGFSIRPWCSSKLLAALQEYRVPLLLSYRKVSADECYDVLREFPQLRLILLDCPRLGRNRLLEPLLERFDSLTLCFGPVFSIHAGFRDLCNRYGTHRWVWGAGYPDCEGGAAITGLMYAGLSEAAVRAIASENIERLLSEVRAA